MKGRVAGSVADPEPVGSELFCQIRIQNFHHEISDLALVNL
jgi:hypothetical protein